jgi:hypothetical protein
MNQEYEICRYCCKPVIILKRCIQCNKLYCLDCMKSDTICFVCDIAFTKLKSDYGENHVKAIK